MSDLEQAAPPNESALARWAGPAGIVGLAFYVGGLFVFYGGQPDSSSAPQKLIDYYGDGGHRDRIAIGWLLILVGVFFFIWFVGGLRQAVRRLAGDGLLASVTTIGGAVYAAVTVVGSSLEAAVKTMSDDTYQHRVYPELIHAVSDAGYLIQSGAGAGIAALMIAASVAAMRARAIPAWLGWLGVVAGVTAVFSIVFIPWLIIGLWVLVASVLLWRSRPAPAV